MADDEEDYEDEEEAKSLFPQDSNIDSPKEEESQEPDTETDTGAEPSERSERNEDEEKEETGFSNEATPLDNLDKLDIDDKSLRLIKSGLNKKALKLILLGVGTITGMGFMVGLQPDKAKAGKPEEKKPSIESRKPANLSVNESDYYHENENEIQPAAEISQPVAAKSTDEATQYPVYDRRKKDVAAKSSEDTARDSRSGLIGTMSENSPDMLAARAGLFYQSDSKSQQDSSSSDSSHTTRSSSQGGTEQETDYESQNMADQKEEFYNSRSNDYTGYLGSLPLSPMDKAHEVKAGTVIPIVLLTAIDSDIPGTIIGQVVENIYDSNTAVNILIPSGTRVTGEYNTSISFGQDRVQVTWRRLILPDGTTINIEGMPGADTTGMSGLSGDVDYHYQNIVGAVALSSTFDIAKLAAESALSTADFLSSLADAITADGSATSGATEATQAIVESYASKVLNQQPTIKIKAGTRSLIIVQKDMVVPYYK